MNSAPRLARRRGGRDAGRDAHWRVLLVFGGFALAAVVLTGLGVGRGFDASVSGPPRQATASVRTAEAPIVLVGIGSQTTDPFYLAGGTYRSDWAAWGEAPEYPPCTHSAELMAVDPANAETSLGHVTDLANLVQVPATGASQASYVYNVKPGDYYLIILSSRLADRPQPDLAAVRDPAASRALVRLARPWHPAARPQRRGPGDRIGPRARTPGWCASLRVGWRRGSSPAQPAWRGGRQLPLSCGSSGPGRDRR